MSTLRQRRSCPPRQGLRQANGLRYLMSEIPDPNVNEAFKTEAYTNAKRVLRKAEKAAAIEESARLTAIAELWTKLATSFAW